MNERIKELIKDFTIEEKEYINSIENEELMLKELQKLLEKYWNSNCGIHLKK